MTGSPSRRVAVVVPRRPSQVGAVDSQLLAAVNLAQGFETSGWQVVLVTEDGPQPLEDVRQAAVRPGAAHPSGRRRLVSRLPRWSRLALADVRALQRRWRLRALSVPGQLDLVVQFHHRFQDAGRRLATRAGSPFVLRVEAIEVEEQRDWGQRGTRSGRLVLALGEQRLFRAADAVAAVSPSLASSLVDLGVEPSRVRALSNGVDVSVFRPQAPRAPSELAEHALAGRFLVGWVGGFRPYHGLEQLRTLLPLLEAQIPDATLCLLGTGPLEAELRELAGRHPRSLVLLPPVPQGSVAHWLCTFDVCLQLARPDGAQHYSPLKVREYLACGRPVVAPAGAHTPELLDGQTALVYPAGDVPAAVTSLARLHRERDLGRRLGEAGRDVMSRDNTWAAVARRMHELAEEVTHR